VIDVDNFSELFVIVAELFVIVNLPKNDFQAVTEPESI
jgi:hypothetical protein